MASSDDRARERQRRRHAERLASGTCTRCGTSPPEPGLKMCRGCAEKRRAADRARRARARQNGLPYAGRDPERCRRAEPACGTLLVGEGIETVLSIVTAIPDTVAAAALSAGSLGVFSPPAGTARIVIARDNDDEGERAALRLARRCARAGVDATVISPRGEDFNDDLLTFGSAALAAWTAAALRDRETG